MHQDIEGPGKSLIHSVSLFTPADAFCYMDIFFLLSTLKILRSTLSPKVVPCLHLPMQWLLLLLPNPQDSHLKGHSIRHLFILPHPRFLQCKVLNPGLLHISQAL